jgi:molecular chaperone DnaK (HSP70)
MGATSTKIWSARVSTSQLEILTLVYNDKLGGSDIDALITTHLAEKFLSEKKIDIKKDSRLMSRLMSQAKRAKEILSVNKVTTITLEANGQDLKATIDRDLMTKICAPLISSIKQLLVKFGKTETLELIGGSSRVPFIQDILKESGAMLSFSLNADEAIVLGTTVYGTLQNKFTVKDHLTFGLCAKVPGSSIEFLPLGDEDFPLEVAITKTIPTGLMVCFFLL